MTHLLTEAIIYGNASVCQTGERNGEMREWVELSLFRKRGRKWPSQWPLPISFQCRLKQIQHSRTGLILDSSLSKQAILQAISYVNTPFSVLSRSHAAELILQYGLDMGHVRYSAANHQHAVWHRGRPAAWGTEWTNTVQRPVGWHWEQSACYSLTFTADSKNTLNLKHTSMMCRRRGLIFVVTEVNYRAGWRAGVRRAVKRH